MNNLIKVIIGAAFAVAIGTHGWAMTVTSFYRMFPATSWPVLLLKLVKMSKISKSATG